MLQGDRGFSLRSPGRWKVREGVPAPSMLESFHAKLPTPFAVLGIHLSPDPSPPGGEGSK